MKGIDEPYNISELALTMFRVVGDTIFISGHVAIDDHGYFVSGGVADQVRQILSNIAAGLEGVGSSLDDVVKTTVYLTEARRDFSEMNEAYREFWAPGGLPARTTIGCALAAELLVEIEGVAVLGSASR